MPTDLLLCAVIAVVAVGVSLWPVPQLMSVAVGLPFLLFVPGYAVTEALFPRAVSVEWSTRTDHSTDFSESDSGLVAFDRFVIAVATSLALAVIVGVNLSFTPWSIRPGSFIGILAAVTLIAGAIGHVRRPPWTTKRDGRGGESVLMEKFSDNNLTVPTLVTGVAVVVALLSVATVGAIDQRGERYTEFALLTQTDSGEFVATDYPSNMSVGESETLHYSITNKEQQLTEYTVIVQLSSLGSDGRPLKQSRLATFHHQVPAGEQIRKRHTVTPTFEGENLRLNYLLYRSEPPERPTKASAYRDLHIWITIDDSGSAETTT